MKAVKALFLDTRDQREKSLAKWQRLSGEGPVEEQLEKARRVERRNTVEDLAAVVRDTEQFNKYLLEKGEHDKLVDYSLILSPRKAQDLRERHKRVFEEDQEHEYRPELVNLDHLLAPVDDLISTVRVDKPGSRDLYETMPDLSSIQFPSTITVGDSTISRPAGSIYEV